MAEWPELNIPAAAVAVTGTHRNELMLFYTLLELTLIVLAGRFGGALAKRCGQSTAVGEIIIDVCLGPSLFGLLAPHAFDYVFHSAPPEPLTILSNLGLGMINVGLDLGVITPKVFTMLVIMAIFSTVITTPALRDDLPRINLKNSQA